MKVEIDESIRRVPALSEPVRQANAFLEELAGATSPHLRAAWRLSPRDDQQIEFVLSEDNGYRVEVRPAFPVKNLLDPVNRKLRLFQVWDTVLQARSKQNMARISESIGRLEAEETDGQ